jgi:hypothetical protein
VRVALDTIALALGSRDARAADARQANHPAVARLTSTASPHFVAAADKRPGGEALSSKPIAQKAGATASARLA